MGRQTKAVLFDRDGTLIKDVPYNGDAQRVEPVPTAVDALDMLRTRGIRTGVVTSARSTPGRSARLGPMTVVRAASPRQAWCSPHARR
jgi:phosphoglycolate phosphatase-like HAD superfamily hydrolase